MTRYKFSHRSDDGKTYYWQSLERVRGSLVEMIWCSVDWFWGDRSKP